MLCFQLSRDVPYIFKVYVWDTRKAGETEPALLLTMFQLTTATVNLDLEDRLLASIDTISTMMEQR